MRSQNRKVKDMGLSLGLVGSRAGKVSCLGLLGLGIALACPTCSSASALTSEELESGALTSSVSISFAPASGSTTLSPTTAAGASGLISVLANVGVTNSGGYSVYLGSNSTNLVGKKDSSVVIPGVSGEVSFDNLQDNTWGYYAGEGSAIPESATYKAISQGQGEAIFANNNSKVKNENKTFVLGFATKIDNSIPADTYENQVTLSVVSNPYQLTLMDIDNMQDMTTAICENTDQLATKQLKDVRDGKYYWVTKLADNNCWMTQNLDLDIPAGEIASTGANAAFYNGSDMSGPWTPTAATTTTISPFSPDVYTESRSWDQGLYILNDPLAGVDCNNSVAGQGLSAIGCVNAGFVDVSDYIASANPDFTNENGSPVNMITRTYDAHYLVGNWYQWNAATAGTGEALTSAGIDGGVPLESDFVDAPSSICPKGWQLPTAGRSKAANNYVNAIARDNSFKALVQEYNSAGINATVMQADEVIQTPLYFVRSGYVISDGYLRASGNDAVYWSSTAYTDTYNAYGFAFNAGATSVYPSNNGKYGRNSGRSVRCIAR